MYATPQHRPRALRRAASVAFVAAGVVAGCWDDDKQPTNPQVPKIGRLEAIVASVGSRVDSNGYVLIVDGADPLARLEFRVEPNSKTEIAVAAGRHSVELEDVAEPCSVPVQESMVAFVVGGKTSAVYFAVNCVAPGALVITTETHGINTDQDGYLAVLGGQIRGELALFDTLLIASVPPGSNLVQLRGVPGNCVTAGGSAVLVHLDENETDNLHFRLTCGPRLDDVAGELLLVASRAHPDQDLDLFLVSSDGRTRERLTDHPGNDYAPSVSPDGRHVAFVRDGSLVILDRAARRETSLPITLPDRVAWSPDGTRFTFARDGSLYIARADGGGLTALTTGKSDDRDPYWSPDGSQIAFTRGWGGESNIHLIDVATSLVRRLTYGGWMVAGPWSPDGTRVLASILDSHCDSYYNWYYYYSSSCDTRADLALVSIGTQTTELVTTTPEQAESSPEWAPSGDRIYFVQENSGQLDVFVVRLDGSAPVNITRSPDYEVSVSAGLLRATGSAAVAFSPR